MTSHASAPSHNRLYKGTVLRGAALAAVLAALSLSACTTLPQSAPFASENSAAKKVNPINDLNEQTWWTGFGDEQLNGLMVHAFDNSPTLAMAEARLNQAQAMVEQSHAEGNPTLGLNANANDAKQSYNYLFPPAFLPKGYTDYGLATFNFNWDLDFWGKNRAAIAAATNTAQAAAADAAQARLILAASISATYIDLDRLYQERDLADRAVGIRQDSAKLVQQKLTSGLSSDADYDQAKAGVFAAQADLDAVDEQIALNRHMLCTLIGASPDQADTIQRPVLKPDPATFANAPVQVNADLIGQRPDVIAARWRAEAASAHIKEAHAAFYPNINLAGFAGVQSLHLKELFKSGSDIGQVGPALSLPLFDGGALKANLASAEAGHALAIASYNEAVLEAMQQVADTVSSQKALQARLDDSQQALAADEDAYNLTKLRYNGGLSNYTTLLIAEQTLINQRRVVTDLKSRALTLDVALIKAVGGQYTGATPPVPVAAN